MKEFTAKTVDDAVKAAAAELGVDELKLIYEVKEEKKSLFKKSATIAVYEDSDAAAYAEEYLVKAIGALGIEITAESVLEEDIIKVTIDSERNPVLIGKGGRTLQAINELVKLAVSNKFRHRYRILLDVGGYKQDKYSRIAYIAKRTARQVQKTHVDVQLDPMTPDERRVVHNALSGMDNIKTESSGEGRDRAVSIKYVK
ncbi:MAG: KH domain-containing protein [Bacilli bacterium]|nr:KH domain-containing protein [Bacilli bacterium]